jgi:hypothetical protein
MSWISIRYPVKALLSRHGACFGVEFSGRAYLFLLAPGAVIVRRRPLGDRTVERLGYNIPRILREIRSVRAEVGP